MVMLVPFHFLRLETMAAWCRSPFCLLAADVLLLKILRAGSEGLVSGIVF
jgi:hypothetical protein